MPKKSAYRNATATSPGRALAARALHNVSTSPLPHQAASANLVASGPDAALHALPSMTGAARSDTTKARTTRPAKRPAQRNLAKNAPPARRKATKGRLLWIGDAVVPTGFATVTHAILEHLRHEWEVVVSGVNYDGGPHCHPYRIMPAQQGQGDMWGMNRFADVCAEFAPDVVVINSDWWNVAGFLLSAPEGLPIVAYMPVDGTNLDPAIVPRLNQLAAAVWYCDFGYREAVQAGFCGPRHVIPHGLNTAEWHPVEQKLARELLALPVPRSAFIVGNVNRNQPRKRLDVTVQLFAEWCRTRDVRNAWLLLHCAKQDTGWDLERLARHHGVADRLLLTGGDTVHQAVDRAKLQLIYSALDVQVSTTLGEGWGLTTMEGMACGVPQIVPNWAALGQWAQPAVKVPCSMQLAHPGINTLGALPDKEAFIAQLDALYRNRTMRRRLSTQGTTFIKQPHFRWEEIARQMDAVLSASVRGKRFSASQRPMPEQGAARRTSLA